MTLEKGQTVGNRYRVVELMGQGGMGAVYRAWDIRLSVPVALKEMIPQPNLDALLLAQLRQQFQQEATILARLNHPHLVDVTDFFEEGRNVYLVMKFIEGESLANRIEQKEPVSEAQALIWAQQLLDALGYCHNRGIIHRDVKPQNVIITPEGQPVLVDFGLVKLWDPHDPRTKTAMRGMGTPEYAPPEQYSAQAGHTDPRSDIYSLGATLYHTLTGQAPLTATDRMADPNHFAPVRGLNPHVSSQTEKAVLRAMELPRDLRFQNAQDMATALSSGARPPAIQTIPKRQSTKVMPKAQPAEMIPKPPALARSRWKETRRWSWILGVLAVLTAITVAFIALRPVTLKIVSGSTVLFTSNHTGKQEIYNLSAEGETVQLTFTPGIGESWSPNSLLDGSVLFTSNRDGKREIYHLTGDGEVVRLTSTSNGAEGWEPDPLPDGNVLFTSNRDGKREIYHLTGDGEVIRLTLTSNGAESWAPTSAPDGSVLFTSNRDGKREIYHLTGDGEVVRLTFTPNGAESWAANSLLDGSVLFTSDRDGKREIYHLAGDGEVVRLTLTPNGAESWAPTSARDGSVLFTSNRDGKREIYRLTGEGDVVRLTYTPTNRESWLSSQ